MEDVSLNTLIVSLLAEGIGAMSELPLAERTTRRPKRRATVTKSSEASTSEQQPLAAAGGEVRP